MISWVRNNGSTDRPSAIHSCRSFFCRYTSSVWLECCPDGRCARLRPFPLGSCAPVRLAHPVGKICCDQTRSPKQRPGKIAEIRLACAEFLATASEFYGVPECGIRLLVRRDHCGFVNAGPSSLSEIRKRTHSNSHFKPSREEFCDPAPS
jgi:hypothetical protein